MLTFAHVLTCECVAMHQTATREETRVTIFGTIQPVTFWLRTNRNHKPLVFYKRQYHATFTEVSLKVSQTIYCKCIQLQFTSTYSINHIKALTCIILVVTILEFCLNKPKREFFVCQRKNRYDNTIQHNLQLILTIHTSLQSFCTFYWLIICLQPLFFSFVVYTLHYQNFDSVFKLVV